MSEDDPRESVGPINVGTPSDDILLADPEVRRRLTEPPPPEERSDQDDAELEHQPTDQ